MLTAAAQKSLLAIPALLRLGIVPDIKKSSDSFSEIPVEGSYGGKRHVGQSVFAGSFHHLSDSAVPVDVHDNEWAGFANYANHLTKNGNTSKYLIGFNHQAGDCGTHWAPQQMRDFRRRFYRLNMAAH
jgi:hypothetical protein